MKTAKYLLFVVVIYFFISCGTSVLYISNTIPADMQQNINTGKSRDVSFSFIGHPDGDMVEVNLGPMWDSAFPLNNPFKGKITELLQSKFSTMNDRSKNKVKVQIINLESHLDEGGIVSSGNYTMAMTVVVEVKRDSLERKVFAYEMGVPVLKGEGGGNAVFQRNLADGVEDLLIKFIIGIDKYFDAINL